MKRTLSTASPAISYTAVAQTTDFGTTQTAVSVRVYQLSAAAGRGSGRAAVI